MLTIESLLKIVPDNEIGNRMKMLRVIYKD